MTWDHRGSPHRDQGLAFPSSSFSKSLVLPHGGERQRPLLTWTAMPARWQARSLVSAGDASTLTATAPALLRSLPPQSQGGARGAQRHSQRLRFSAQQISPCIRFSLTFCASTSVCRGRRQGQKIRASTQQKKQQPDSSVMFPATYSGLSRMADKFPFPSQITLPNIVKSVKARNRHQSSVLGCPRWDSEPRRPSCSFSPHRPSSTLGAGRITADRSAAGPGYLKGWRHRSAPARGSRTERAARRTPAASAAVS